MKEEKQVKSGIKADSVFNEGNSKSVIQSV